MLEFNKTEFLKSATKYAQFPPPDRPEIAIVGRSNVGKSSLLNMLCERKALARVSRTPGRTQLVNFFDVGKSARIVDLPGYGFADVPAAVQRTWDTMMHDYLAKRELLLGLLLLLDVRREPSEHDLLMFDWSMERGLPVLPILTKTDKVCKNECFNRVQKTAKMFGTSPKNIIVTSVLKNQGRDLLRESINALFDDFFDAQRNDIVIIPQK